MKKKSIFGSMQCDRLSLIKPAENIPLRNTRIVKKKVANIVGGMSAVVNAVTAAVTDSTVRILVDAFYIKYQVSTLR